MRRNSILQMLFLLIIFFSIEETALSQGRNSIFFMGYHDAPTSNEARMVFTGTSYNLSLEQRDIPFIFTQGNIADENGNILMSSNGIFIADATGDTMLDGGGLNPDLFTDDWKQYGLPMPYANLFLPMPDDSNKYVLFHQVADYNAPVGLDALEIYYSNVDLSMNGGLGQVISKNNIALSGVFSWGIAACKHGNGRDWWIVAMSDIATGMHVFLLTPDTLQYMGLQTFPVTGFPYGFAGQPVFSPDGEKFAFGGSYGITGMNYLSCVSLFDFDRCSGIFSLDTVIDYSDNYLSTATTFSPSSKYLYFASVKYIYQYDTDSFGLIPYQLVAVNDTFLSAPPVFYTDFNLMYLAANGKIYISSGSSVLDLHEMDYPDSAGVLCNVNLHNIHTNCFFRGVPNHPNYYLGRLVGSVCDSLTSVSEIGHDFKFKILPNPNNGNFKIMYLLPQNTSGKLEIFDINGRAVYSQNLPQWSTLQFISLPKISNGVYAVKIISDNFSVTKKLIMYHE
ncbi:MAG TPA: T9SS type A sorting domain-containing protein [Bacteroidia bacterium]|nr:T9SS type A sorting domain-containing protein [Bacteroidia bacterium]HNG85262.1 T9SS type A sorting domain-containing protein [Bacteroidia bacterium]